MTLPWYFIMDLGLWAMTVVVILWTWPKIGRVWRLCASCTAVVVMILQSINEVMSCRIFLAWTFSYEYNRMIGISFLGDPLEEHLFWWAFAWLAPFFYLGLVDWFEKWDQKRGRPARVTAHE